MCVERLEGKDMADSYEAGSLLIDSVDIIDGCFDDHKLGWIVRAMKESSTRTMYLMSHRQTKHQASD